MEERSKKEKQKKKLVYTSSKLIGWLTITRSIVYAAVQKFLQWNETILWTWINLIRFPLEIWIFFLLLSPYIAHCMILF